MTLHDACVTRLSSRNWRESVAHAANWWLGEWGGLRRPCPAEGKQASLQREIASVMAACGLRNIRYVAFPPVVFETPAAAATPEPLPAIEADPAPMIAEVSPPPAPERPEVTGAPLPAEPPLLPPAAAAMPALPVVPIVAEAALADAAEPAPSMADPPPAVPLPGSPRPGMRRLAEFDAELSEATRPRREGPALSVVNEAEATPGVAPVRNYALLRDIAGELRPRRARARGGKRA
jgi:hypothetical protein